MSTKEPGAVIKRATSGSRAIGSRPLVYSDGEFIKNCLELFRRRVFPEKKCAMEQLNLSRFTMARRIDDLSENMEPPLQQKIANVLL